ncbi:MAG: hypothetical protein ACREC0_00465 [Methylocella sp.]
MTRLGPGLNFSWKRASGISGMKNRLSRRIGIPLPQGGRERKIGRAVIRGIGALMFWAMLAAAGGIAAIFGWK